MVKTKRTFARTAVLASAALALSARGADAVKVFQAGGASYDLFASGVTPLNCNLLWFDTDSGVLMGYSDGNAATGGAAVQGLAVDDNGGSPPTDINHCKTAPGAYLHTAAAGTLYLGNTNADGLKVFKSPVGWYAAGGINFLTGTDAVAVAPASLTSSSTNVGSTTVDECAAGTYSAAGASSCSTCATGTTSNAGAEFCGIVAAGYYGTAGAGTAPSYTSAATATACSATFSGATAAGITSSQLTTASNDKTACETAPGYIITSAASVADGSITVAQAAAGKYAAGGTPLVTANAANSGTATETASTCATGTTSNAGAEYCGIVAAGYYGTAGAGTAPSYTSAATATACSATFSGATAAGITSDQTTTGTTDKTACKTAPGYIITSAVNAADSAITVAQAAAGKYAAGGTTLVTSNAANEGTAAETASTCAANTYSAAGAASCTACPTGQTSAAGASACAASPDSAGASTPIAVALAAAAAVPLLL